MGRPKSHASSKTASYTDLQSTLDDLFDKILAKSSLQTYKRAVNHYKSFANEYGMTFQLPIDSSDLILFIAYLKNKSFVASTISTYISAISFLHKINQKADPTNSFLVEKILQAVHKERTSDCRLPITGVVLNQIVNALRFTVSCQYEQILLTAMFTLAYHALLRVGEITVNNNNLKNLINFSQVAMFDEKVVVNFVDFKHSKGKSFRLEIKKNKNIEICAVIALKKYVAIRNKMVGALFINANGVAISRQFFQDALNNALNFCGLSQVYYKPHSFRIGFATDAITSGMSSENIRILGRWKSDAYKIYIRQAAQISDLQ